jgi:hypothetical protein
MELGHILIQNMLQQRQIALQMRLGQVQQKKIKLLILVHSTYSNNFSH